MLIDTHAHLYAEEFDEDRDAMIQRALKMGVEKFFLPAIDATSIPKMYALEQQYPEQIFLLMGLHPCYVNEDFRSALAIIKEQLSLRNFSAIGEIGIDLYWDKSTLPIQQLAFKQQIQWAKERQLPIVIHCRDAFDEIFEILEEEKSLDLFGIFHCFTGTHKQALQAISYGMKLGIGGVVTFKNGKIDQFLHEIDLKHIVLETDAPYLAPAPMRGKRNESSFLTLVLKKLAAIYNLSEAEIAQKTTENAMSIFKDYKQGF
jgi:TatD DNase family protein